VVGYGGGEIECLKSNCRVFKKGVSIDDAGCRVHNMRQKKKKKMKIEQKEIEYQNQYAEKENNRK
jgi:hypothetical protein